MEILKNLIISLESRSPIIIDLVPEHYPHFGCQSKSQGYNVANYNYSVKVAKLLEVFKPANNEI